MLVWPYSLSDDVWLLLNHAGQGYHVKGSRAYKIAKRVGAQSRHHSGSSLCAYVRAQVSHLQSLLGSTLRFYRWHSMRVCCTSRLCNAHEDLVIFLVSVCRCRANLSGPIDAQVALKLLRDRANDGSQQFVNFVPSPANGPVGKYQVHCLII